MPGLKYATVFAFIVNTVLTTPLSFISQHVRSIETHNLKKIFLVSHDGVSSDNRNIIDSQSNIIASIIRKSLNKSVDPCVHFYNYSCGNWEANFPLPDDQVAWDVDKMLEHDINIRLREILEEEIKPDDVVPLIHEKLWYRSCMNLAKLEDDGIKPLEEVLNRSGGWPITMKNIECCNQNDWQDIHKYYMAFQDVNALFDIIVSNDARNTSKYIIMIDEPTETLYDEMLNSNDANFNLNKYEHFMKKVATLFLKSADREISFNQIDNDVKDVMDFEKKLHYIKSTATQKGDFERSQNYMTIHTVQNLYDQENHRTNTSKINWLETIKSAFKEVNVTIDESEEIQIVDVTYIHKLATLLDNTPNRVIVNYIHWKFIVYTLEYTTREMIDLAVEVALEHRGFKKEPERWLTCLSDMKPRYGIMFKYINKYFHKDKRDMGLKMSATIRNEMINQIKISSWLDESTKRKTIGKLNKLTVNMGYTKLLSNATFLAHVYDELKIGSNYCENVQNYRKYEMKRNLQYLRKYDTKDSKNNLLMDPLQVNALYQHHTNSLIVTAAQLSIPFFNVFIPMSVNYGYMGSIIAHEISHAMDNEGRLYSENGNVETWWPDNMIQIFKNKSQCFVDQFDNYSLDGHLTLSENMADTTGLQVSYDAFKRISNKTKEPKLPGLDELTPDQLFFVSFALSYCQTPAFKFTSQHLDDVHSPNVYRIIGSVMNSESFAAAFNCVPEAPMNSNTKCQLWK